MLINLPVDYEISGKKIGNKHPASYQVREIQRIEITEVSEHYAPVAVSWLDRFPTGAQFHLEMQKSWGVAHAEGAAHTVFYNNQHWRSLHVGNMERQPTLQYRECETLTAEFLQAHLEGGYASELITTQWVSLDERRLHAPDYRDPSELFSEISSTERSQLKRNAERASKLIIVNGRLYQQCKEPVIFLQQTHIVINQRVVDPMLLRVCPGDHVPSNASHVYSLTDYNEALQRVRSQANGYGIYDEMADNFAQYSPTIFLPESVDHDSNRRQRVINDFGKFFGNIRNADYGSFSREERFLLADLERTLFVPEDEFNLFDVGDAASNLLNHVREKKSPIARKTYMIEEIVNYTENSEIKIAQVSRSELGT
jgi:hypothetical protein